MAGQQQAGALHIDMPSGCDKGVERSIATWNNVRSKFQFQFNPSTSITFDRAAVSNNANVTIEDGTPPSLDAGMTTALRRQSGVISDADIIVRSTYLFYSSDESGGQFHCSATGTAPPSTKWDFETALTHELGHAFGFGDATSLTACILYYSLTKGVTRRSPCAQEVSGMKTMYGAL